MVDFPESTCYILSYEDGKKITFKIAENSSSSAVHLVKVKDCLSGKVHQLFELLLKPWIDIKRMPCSECALP